MTLIRLILASILICLLVTSSTADDGDSVTLPELIERFVSEFGDIHGITIAEFTGSSYAVAIVDQSERVSVTTGTRTRWRRLDVDVAYASAPTIHLADLDGDNRVELLVGSDQLEVFKIEEQKLVRVWASEKVLKPEIPPTIAVADLNGNGQVEIVALTYRPEMQDDAEPDLPEDDAGDGKDDDGDQPVNNLHVFSRIANQKPDSQKPDAKKLSFDLAAEMTLVDRHGSQYSHGLACGDFTGNSCDEIVVGNDNGFLWHVAFKNGALKVLGRSEVPSGGAIGPGLKRANMDQDQADELLVGTNGGDIHVCDFTSAGEFRWLHTTTAGRMAYGVNAADFNGDGVDEFVLSRGAAGYAGMTKKDTVVQVFEFVDGELKERFRRETLDLPRTLMYDLDGDGKRDIIAYSGGNGGPQIEVFQLKLVQ